MFSFFKNTLEKDLIKLGFGKLIEGYKQKVRTKEWSERQYKEALRDFHTRHISEVRNAGNVNVATRQSFDDDELMVPLNLQNIQQEFIDIDYLYSSLLFEYHNHKRVHTKALHELEKLLKERFPDAVEETAFYNTYKDSDMKQLIELACLPMEAANKDRLKVVFSILRNRM